MNEREEEPSNAVTEREVGISVWGDKIGRLAR